MLYSKNDVTSGCDEAFCLEMVPGTEILKNIYK